MNTKVKYVDNYTEVTIRDNYNNYAYSTDYADTISGQQAIKDVNNWSNVKSVIPINVTSLPIHEYTWHKPNIWIDEACRYGKSYFYMDSKLPLKPVPLKDIFIKDDTGKTEYHHIPWDVIEDVAEVLTEGEKKYPGDNWKKCTDKNRYLNAVDRHLMDWRLDEREDADSGQSHLVHAICNLLFLAKLEKEGNI